MLPKKKRVTKYIFQDIMKKGNLLSSPFFVFRYIKQRGPQYAFVVPKSMAKKAVDRNRFRRQGYNIIRQLTNLTGLGVFMYKKLAKGTPLGDIKEDIQKLLKTAKII